MYGLLLEILPSKSIAFYYSVPHGATAGCPRRARCMSFCWKYYLLRALRLFQCSPWRNSKLSKEGKMYCLLLEILPSKSIVFISVFCMVQRQVVQGGQAVWLIAGNITF